MKKITQILLTRNYSTRLRSLLVLILGVFSFVYFSDVTFAADDQLGEFSTAFMQLLHLFLVAASILLGIFTSLAGLFLSPEWTSGAVFNLSDKLEDLWVLSSNIVYLIFAGLFLAIAFMNIIGKGEGDWAIKQALPRFLIAGLFIPFSLLFVKLIVSIANILMVSVISIPYDTVQKDNANLFKADNKICKHVIVNLDAIKSEKMIECKQGSQQTLNEYYNTSLTGLVHIYIYGILNVQNLDKLLVAGEKDGVQQIMSFGQLSLKMFFDVIFVVIYLILIISIMAVLFVRAVMLWLYIMISPFFALQIFFGSDKGGDNAFSKFSIKGFIGLALVPVYVGIALSFGLMFMVIVSQIGLEAENSEVKGEAFEVAGFEYKFEGYQSNAQETKDGTKTTQTILYGAKDSISFLIMQIFGIVFLWMAVMTALKQSDITKSIIKPVEDFGGKVKDMALKLPTYAPIIPSKDGGAKTSFHGLQTSIGRFESFIEKKSTDKTNQWAESNGLGFLVQGTKAVTNLKLAINEMKNTKVVLNGTIGDTNKFIEILKKNNINMSDLDYSSIKANPQLKALLIDSTLFKEDDFADEPSYVNRWISIHNDVSNRLGESIFGLGKLSANIRDKNKMFSHKFNSDKKDNKINNNNNEEEEDKADVSNEVNNSETNSKNPTRTATDIKPNDTRNNSDQTPRQPSNKI